MLSSKHNRTELYDLRPRHKRFKCRTKDPYPDDARQNHRVKRQVNQVVAKKAFQLRCSSKDMAMLLDSASMRSANAVYQGSGLLAKNIHVPNNCRDTVQRMLEAGTPHCSVFFETAHTLLQRDFRRRYALIWLDYCGLIDGNKTFDIQPIADIPLAFQHMRRGEAVLAVTFSWRRTKSHALLARVKELLTESATKENYLVHEFQHKIYEKMLFVLVHVYTEGTPRPTPVASSDLGRRLRNVW